MNIKTMIIAGIATLAAVAFFLQFSAKDTADRTLPRQDERLISALIAVESNGNDYAVGDNGRSAGCLQINKCVVDDVNRVCGTAYSYADRFNREKSKEIFRHYMGIYATSKRLKRTVTNEDRARIWNGGPNGYVKAATKQYWRRVKNRM